MGDKPVRASSKIATALTGGLLAGAVVLAGTVALAGLAQADAIDDSFLGALSGAGINVDDPAATTALGQSVCPMISDNSDSIGNVVSAVSNATSPVTGKPGVDPDMAGLFTQIAVDVYCPSMMSQLSNGQVPNVGLPGLNGGDSLNIPGLAGGIPGLPGGIPAIPGL